MRIVASGWSATEKYITILIYAPASRGSGIASILIATVKLSYMLTSSGEVNV
jgi:hypothetical protein